MIIIVIRIGSYKKFNNLLILFYLNTSVFLCPSDWTFIFNLVVYVCPSMSALVLVDIINIYPSKIFVCVCMCNVKTRRKKRICLDKVVHHVHILMIIMLNVDGQQVTATAIYLFFYDHHICLYHWVNIFEQQNRINCHYFSMIQRMNCIHFIW